MFWGVNVAAVPKVIYKCPNVTKGKLEVTHPDHFNDMGWLKGPSGLHQRWQGGRRRIRRETKYVPFLQKGTSTIKVFRGVEKWERHYFPLADTRIKTRPLWYQAT